ncbi:MAG: RNA polymerase sigma factor [Acutalibacteraceae bacterium]
MSSQLKNLVIRAQNGDAEAFGELYGFYADDMYRFAYYYTCSQILAQDAVSDAALRAFESIKNLKKPESFKSWLFKILFVCCTNAQKEKARSLLTVPLSQAENLSSDGHDYIENIELQKAMQLLSEEEKEIVVLTFACGLKSDEIAKLLNLKAVTVRSKLSRSVKKLRRYMNS